MANVTPVPAYDNVELLETSDRVLGGPATAPANKQAQKIMNYVEALKQATLKGALNSVIHGPEDFVGITGLELEITGTVTPILFNFANGFSATGPHDVIVKFTGTEREDFTANLGEFLAFARYVGGAVVFEYIEIGSSNLKYAVTDTAPATIGGTQYYFNVLERKMYRESGGAWVADLAILIGGLSAAVAVTWYTRPYGTPVWDSHVFPGQIIPLFENSSVPSGWLELDGTTYKAVQYPELFLHAIGTTTPYTFTTPYDEFDLPGLSTSHIGTPNQNAIWAVRAWY